MQGAAAAGSATRRMLIRRGLTLEYLTLGWNVVGTVVSILAAVAAGSVALAGFGLDSMIEIGASIIVIWQLNQRDRTHDRRGLRLIGGAFITLALYIAGQALYTLIAGQHPHHSILGIAWTAATCVVMLALAAGKARTGKALDNPVLQTEGYPEQALQIITTLELDQYPYLHSTRGELLARVGRTEEARAAFQRAVTLSRSEPERPFLTRKLNAQSG